MSSRLAASLALPLVGLRPLLDVLVLGGVLQRTFGVSGTSHAAASVTTTGYGGGLLQTPVSSAVVPLVWGTKYLHWGV